MRPSSKNNEFLGLCNHTVNLEADSKILYYGLVKIYSFYRKVQQRLTEIYLVKQQPQEQPQKSHKQDIPQKHLQIDRLSLASHGMHATNYFASLALFMCQGRRTQR